jgi:hypothetical protein
MNATGDYDDGIKSQSPSAREVGLSARLRGQNSRWVMAGPQ